MSDGDDEPTDATDEEPARDTDAADDESAPEAEATEDEGATEAEESEDDAAPETGGSEDEEATETGESEDEVASEAEGTEDEEAAEGTGPDAETDPGAAEDVSVEDLDDRLDAVEADLEAAETETDLDAVEADLADAEVDLEAADLPEPDDEDEEAPRERLEARVSELRDAIEEARGPYASDVAEEIRTARSTVAETEWTETGETEAATAVDSFVADVEEILDASFAVGDTFPQDHAAALDEVATTVEDGDLDPDADAESIGDLLDATENLQAALEDAEEWDDLTVVEQLAAEGFYDRLDDGYLRDFPPELSVVRIAERENDPERILAALDAFESDFMEENCIDALRRLGPSEATDAMLERAERRNVPAIEVLGKIGDPAPLDTLHEFIEGEANPPLQKATLKAIGEIGAGESTQAVADRLVAEDPEVRSHAARALGRIGDPRAVEPLSDVLADDDSDTVRAAAAWALHQIGTERALEEAAQHADDRSYIVESEARKAGDALDTSAPSA